MLACHDRLAPRKRMNSRKRHLIPATALLVLVGFCFVSIFKSPSPPDHKSGEKSGKESKSESIAPDAPVASADIRSKSRVRHPIPTLEETRNLLNTVIPLADLPPDRSVKETAEAINKLLEEAGIPPHQLRVTYYKSNPQLGSLRMENVRIRNAPVAAILQYLCGSTKVRYVVRPGVVLFLAQIDSLETEPAPAEPDDPDDPFGNSPANHEDPFAAPSVR